MCCLNLSKLSQRKNEMSIVNQIDQKSYQLYNVIKRFVTMQLLRKGIEKVDYLITRDIEEITLRLEKFDTENNIKDRIRISAKCTRKIKKFPSRFSLITKLLSKSTDKTNEIFQKFKNQVRVNSFEELLDFIGTMISLYRDAAYRGHIEFKISKELVLDKIEDIYLKCKKSADIVKKY